MGHNGRINDKTGARWGMQRSKAAITCMGLSKYYYWMGHAEYFNQRTWYSEYATLLLSAFSVGDGGRQQGTGGRRVLPARHLLSLAGRPVASGIRLTQAKKIDLFINLALHAGYAAAQTSCDLIIIH